MCLLHMSRVLFPQNGESGKAADLDPLLFIGLSSYFQRKQPVSPGVMRLTVQQAVVSAVS